MQDKHQVDFGEDGISIGQYVLILRNHWWKILGVSFAVGLITLLLMFLQPNYYKATAVIAPVGEEGKQTSTLGVLASFGVVVGSPNKAEDLEALFKSKDLTVRVFRKYKLWPFIMPDSFDEETGKMSIGWMDRLFGRDGEWKLPSDWDAIRAAQSGLVVAVNRKNGTISLSFESRSAEGSAKIVRYYLDEAKNRLQEEAFERAGKNKKFIEEQISRTVDALNRDRLYTLYGQEVEREMMARNREQFGFRVIDAPRVPDRKFKPKRGLSAIAATIMAIFITCAFLIVRSKQG